MKKICFVTGTRADYGIMAPIMKEVASHPEAKLQIIATNMHLSPQYGMTVNEIEADGFKPNFKIECLEEGTTAASTVTSMGKLQEGLAEAYEKLKPDIVVILGDRYEALVAASAAVVFNIPVAHLHGGEITEGAIDDRFRNAITKLSDLHFAATPEYASRIVNMGEDGEKVFHSGAPGAEVDEGEMDHLRASFEEKTGLEVWNPFIILAFHPVTLLPDKGLEELRATLNTLDSFVNENLKVLLTMPNSDPGSSEMMKLLKEWAQKHGENVKTVDSLGASLFHYAMDNASAMIGNSSAALIEAPSHRLAAVNVGRRQKGRAHGITVIDAPADSKKIETALKAALSLEMKSVLMGFPVSALNPYFKEDAASFIADKLINYKTSDI